MTAAAVLGVVISLALGPGRATLVEAGRKALTPHDRVVLEASRPRRSAALAFLLGDSTFRPPHSYPALLRRRLAPQAEVRPLWAPGMGPAEHYLLLGRALALRPQAVVLVANLRLLWGDGPLWYPDLLTLLPPGELPHALRLPFHAREVGAARLILASLLGTLPTDMPLYLFTGGHVWARRVPLLRWTEPLRSARAHDPERLRELRTERVGRYGERLYPGHPALAMIGASVEQARRRGARVLVLVSPAPVQRLIEAGVYREAALDDRVARVCEVTVKNGGECLDLHDALAAEDFSDDLGHFSASGVERVAARLEPWLRSALGAAGGAPR